jgi:nucleoside 2-deoxyribosyltransferase
MLKIYLAGPMSGLTWRQAAERRSPYYTLFEGDEVWLLDPLRGKTPTNLDEMVSPTAGLQSMTARQIFERDLRDVRTADVVLVDFRGAKCVSIGTVWEMAVAHERRTPIIVVDGPDPLRGYPHRHLFIDEGTTMWTSSPSNAVAWIKECYL